MKVNLYVLALFALVCSCTQNNKNTIVQESRDTLKKVVPVTPDQTNALSNVITKFVRAYRHQDNEKVNKLIHPDLGFTIIYRSGASDTFERVDTLDFTKPVPSYYAYDYFDHDYTLTYERLPLFDCGTEKWDKEGFFCDTTSHPNQLSNIIAFEEEFDKTKYTEKQMDAIEHSEEESFRVILTSRNDKSPLVFHVRLYQGKWYVTTLDRAFASCSA